MGVNLASMVRAWRDGRMAQWIPILLSFGGLLTCFFLWFHLGHLAMIAGTVWAVTGVLLWLLRRRYTVLPGEAAV
jgi:hypothetical protein